MKSSLIHLTTAPLGTLRSTDSIMCHTPVNLSSSLPLKWTPLSLAFFFFNLSSLYWLPSHLSSDPSGNLFHCKSFPYMLNLFTEHTTDLVLGVTRQMSRWGYSHLAQQLLLQTLESDCLGCRLQFKHLLAMWTWERKSN